MDRIRTLLIAAALALLLACPASAQYQRAELSYRTTDRPVGSFEEGRARYVEGTPELDCPYLRDLPEQLLGTAGQRPDPQVLQALTSALQSFDGARYSDAIDALRPTLASDNAVTKYAFGCIMEALGRVWLMGDTGPGLVDAPSYAPIVTAINRSRIVESGHVVTALTWIERAAEADFEPAQWSLARRAADRDTTYPAGKSLRWYARLASLGNLTAAADLGTFYRDGLHVPQDLAEAMRLFRLAAKGGDRRGMLLLADAYRQGLAGSGRDEVAAAFWLRQLANGGDSIGQYLFGLALRDGRGVRADPKRAISMLRHAADHNVAGAQYALAMLLESEGERSSSEVERLLAAAAAPVAERRHPRHCMAALEFLERHLKRGMIPRVDAGQEAQPIDQISNCWASYEYEWFADPLFKAGDRLFNAGGPAFDVDWKEFARRASVAALALGEPADKVGVPSEKSRPDFPDVSVLNRNLSSGVIAERLSAAVDLRRIGLGRAAIEVVLTALEDPATSQDDRNSGLYFFEMCWWSSAFSEWVTRESRSGAVEGCSTPEVLTFATSEQLRRLVAVGVDNAAVFLGVRNLLDPESGRASEGLRLLEAPPAVPASTDQYWRDYRPYPPVVVGGTLLGVWLEEGRGIEADPERAAAAFRQSRGADLRNDKGRLHRPSAVISWRLGRMMFEGQTPEARTDEGAELVEEAAGFGLVPARTTFGDVLMARGDREAALRWYRGAALANDPLAMVRFGYLADVRWWNERGLGATRWYELAKSFDDPMVDLELARAVAFAPERRGSAALVRYYLERSAEQANHWARRWLAACPETVRLSCYLDQPGFSRRFFRVVTPVQKHTEPLKIDPTVARRELEASQKALLGRLEVASANRDPDSIDTLLAQLETLNAHHDNPERAIGYRLERVLKVDAELHSQGVGSQNYFSLLTSACHWGQASRFAYRIGRPNAAIWFAKVSVNRLQAARALIRELEGDVRECFLEAHQDRYRWLADLFIDAGRFADAQAVLDMLKDFEHQTYIADTAERGDSGNALAMSPREAAASRSLARAQATDAAPSELRQFLQDLKSEIAALDVGENRGTRIDVDALASRKIQSDLARRPHTAIIQAVVLPDRVAWIVSTSDGRQEGIAISIERRRLAQLIRAYLEAMQAQSPAIATRAEDLYRAVFQPVDQRLSALGVREVLVSADGQLRYVPFAALWDGRHWLVERYVFSSFRRREDYLSDSPRTAGRIAGFGATRASGVLPALPGVATELKSIVRTPETPALGFLPGTIRLDGLFNRAALEEALASDFSIIHIASHFVLDPASAEKSYLLLGDGTPLLVRDFERSERLTFRLAQLVTLSACRTALGDGIEIESLASIAQEAGAPAVVASLWSVADPSTAELMRRFYHNRERDGLSTAHALRAAQREMLASGGTTAHPYHWAPFVLMGRRD